MKNKRLTMVLCMMLIVTFVFPGTALAANSDSWYVCYAKNVPGTDPIDYLYVSYYSDGYVASASYLTGSYDRRVTISSSDAGGMTPKEITQTGKSYSWKMKGSSTKDVEFTVTATGTVSCASKGTIYVNN